MAKIIFHNIQMEEVTHNLQETKKEVGMRFDWWHCMYWCIESQTAEMNKELRSAAKSGNKSKVTRLKESISSLQAEENSYAEKQEQHDRELSVLQGRCKQVDQEIYASGVTQLPTAEERG